MSRKRDQIARWVESASGHTPTADEARCIEALCVIDTGPHNLHPINGWDGPNIRWGGIAVGIVIGGRDISTTDSDAMARLVIAGHRLAVRINVSPVLVGYTLRDGESGEAPEDYDTTVYEPGSEHHDDDYGVGLQLLAHAREVARPNRSGMVTHSTLDQLVARIQGGGR